jgi:predicted enzyme related to lactoylglutathione lyase
MARVSICIDVPDLTLATAFYRDAIGCSLEKSQKTHNTLSIDGVTIQLLLRAEATEASGTTSDCLRTYERHWTPVHLDFDVSDIDEAVEKVQRHDGTVEDVQRGDWGAMASCVDPFGNGLCLLAMRA